jgi:hypothetical protein
VKKRVKTKLEHWGSRECRRPALDGALNRS